MTKPPVIAPIVEGHGEVSAVREIVTRIGLELLNGTWIEVAQPFRLDSGKMRKPDELAKAIRIGAARVQGSGGVLVLRDGDDADVDCPVQLAEMLRPGRNLVTVGVEIVVAYQEYESWFLAAADSLRAHPDVRNDAVAPENPEGRRDAKRELEKLMLESYKETRHQPRFSALIDLKTASKNSRSFRRMVHAVETLADEFGTQGRRIHFRVSRAKIAGERRTGRSGRGCAPLTANHLARAIGVRGRVTVRRQADPVTLCDGYGIFLVAVSGQVGDGPTTLLPDARLTRALAGGCLGRRGARRLGGAFAEALVHTVPPCGAGPTTAALPLEPGRPRVDLRSA